MRRGDRGRERALHTAIGSIVEREEPGRSIDRLRVTPSRYASSARLSVIDVDLDDGKTFHLVLKECGLRDRLPGAPALARFIQDVDREVDVYKHLLADAPLDTPRLYSTVRAPSVGRYWLFLERVAATELRWSVRSTAWARSAAWLANAHVALGRTGVAPASLLRHDAAYYRRWLHRARRFIGPTDDSRRTRLAWVAAHYDAVIDMLTSLPRTVIHGEFYPSNILVDDSQPEGRISVVDWEMAAIGPAVIDLAALTGGRHAPEDRDAMVDAYRAVSAGDRAAPIQATSPEALTSARLHFAVQWLGWAPDWHPPEEQRQDWLTEAVELGESLGW